MDSIIQKQIKDIENKLITLKGTPAEATLKKVLSQLKSKLPPVKHSVKPAETSSYFQAIGWIKASVIETKNGNKIDKKLIFMGKEYKCRYLTKRCGGFVNSNSIFSKYIANKGELILGVYPRWTHFPSRDKEAQLTFDIFSWNNIPSNRKLNLFYVSGIWQFIPVCRQPVLSVYRNKARYNEDKLKVDHCPVFWKNAPHKPFRYNPKLKNNVSSERFFVNTICTFDPSRNQLYVKEYSSLSTTIPSFKKPKKLPPSK